MMEMTPLLFYSKNPVLMQVVSGVCEHKLPVKVQIADTKESLLSHIEACTILVVLLGKEEKASEWFMEWQNEGVFVPAMICVAYGYPEYVALQGTTLCEYMAYPFRLTSLFERIQKVISLLETQRIQLGAHVWFHPRARLLIWENTSEQQELGYQYTHLTEKESALIKYLHDAKTRRVNKAELLQEVWGYHAEVDTHTLETHIYRLRQKTPYEHFIINDDQGYSLGL